MRLSLAVIVLRLAVCYPFNTDDGLCALSDKCGFSGKLLRKCDPDSCDDIEICADLADVKDKKDDGYECASKTDCRERTCPEIDECDSACDGQQGYSLEKCGEGVICTHQVDYYIREEGFACNSQRDCGKCSRAWTPGILDIGPDGHKIRHLAKDLQGNLEEGRLTEFDQILDAEECQVLMDHIDKAYYETMDSGAFDENSILNTAHDFQVELSIEDLAGLLKHESITKLHDTFKDFDPESSIQNIRVRRTMNDNEETFIDWHVDGPLSILHLYLNGDDIQGGNLHYVVSSSGAAVDQHSVIPTPSKTGAGVMVGNRLLHGFTGFQGTRYTFLLIGGSPHSKDIFEDFIGGPKNTAMHKA